MNNDFDHFPRISPGLVNEYERLADAIVESVNACMRERDDLAVLIGPNNLEIMYENHRNHAAFMTSVLHFGNYGLLAQTLPWVYRTYYNRGFSHAYFATVLPVWMGVIREFMGEGSAGIQSVYKWLLDRHEETVKLSLRPATEPDAGSREWQEDYERFRDALLTGDVSICLNMAMSRVDTAERMVDFFMHVLQPAMYAVGARWENGLIGVAQERLASVIVSRTLASISVSGFSPSGPERGKAVVSTAANDYHEIGAWMLALCLESDGWDVRYLGANTPRSDLLAFVRSEKPDLLCLSVAMIFNLGEVKSVIESVRCEESMAGTGILVGGQALMHEPDIFHALRADAMAADCRSAVKMARAFTCRRIGES